MLHIKGEWKQVHVLGKGLPLDCCWWDSPNLEADTNATAENGGPAIPLDIVSVNADCD